MFCKSFVDPLTGPPADCSAATLRHILSRGLKLEVWRYGVAWDGVGVLLEIPVL